MPMPIVFPTVPQEPITRDPKLLVMFAQPKQGKTTALGMLEGNLLIDLEDGSDHVRGLILKASNLADISEILKGLKDQGLSYAYITLDTTTVLEEIAKELAKKLYQDTPMGKKWGKINPRTGKPNPGEDDITELPNGAGYHYLRKAFQKIVDSFKPYVTECLILSGHVKDKLITRDGKEVPEMELDLAGKLSRLTCSKADAVGLVRRVGNKVYINFNGGGDTIIESRSEHLAGKTILLTEKNTDGTFVSHWDDVFLNLKNQ